MHFSHYVAHLIGDISANGPLVGLSIILATFILEDPTTIMVGVLAADGVIPIPLALVSLWIGIAVGDVGVYGLGALARTHPRLAKFVDHDLIVPFRTWIETNYMMTIFSVRFVPGLRLPTYTASGFFRSPLRKFAIASIGATLIWTTLLFGASYWFGSVTSHWLSEARFGIAFAVLLMLFFAGRNNLRKQRAKQLASTDAAHS